MNTAERDLRVLWHPFTQMKTAGLPLAIKRAKDALLFGEDGKTYIDAISSWWVTLHGHSHPHIQEKICEQLADLSQIIFAGLTHPRAVELAERLAALLPSRQSRIFYSDDGSTAVEAALKMAIQYWHNIGEPRSTIVALNNGYHGDTFGAMSVGERGVFNQPYHNLLFKAMYVDAPFEENAAECLDQLEEFLLTGDVAAFIYEPLVQGAGGMLMYDPRGLDQMLALCKKHGTLCIADEVMTGFGRTGKLFASQHMTNEPDIMCLSKALTGGVLPLGVTSATDDIYNAFLSEKRERMFWHGHSFSGNALSCAAAVASLDLIAESSFSANIRRINVKHSEFAAVLADIQSVNNVRNIGTILAFDLDSVSATSYLHPLRDRLYNFFIDHGVLLRPLGNVLYVLPPLCITDQQLDTVYQLILDGIEQVR